MEKQVMCSRAGGPDRNRISMDEAKDESRRAHSAAPIRPATREPFARSAGDRDRHGDVERELNPDAAGWWLVVDRPPASMADRGRQEGIRETVIEEAQGCRGGRLTVCAPFDGEIGEMTAAPTRAAAENVVLAWLDDLRSRADIAAQGFAWNALELRGVVQHVGTGTLFEFNEALRRFVPLRRHAEARFL